MLEMGLVRSIKRLQNGDQGLLVEDDGPSIEVKVLKTPRNANAGANYIFTNLTTGEEIIAATGERYSRWDFYEHTTPVPFVPRPGSIEAASLPASSQLLGEGGSTSAPFITASAPPLSPSLYAEYQLPYPAASAAPFSPSSYAAYQLPYPAASAAPFSPSSYGAQQLPFPMMASAPPLSPSSYAEYNLPFPPGYVARPPTPRKLQTVTVTPGGRRKLRKTRGRKIKKTRKNKRRHI
jgi:hypothetical protein